MRKRNTQDLPLHLPCHNENQPTPMGIFYYIYIFPFSSTNFLLSISFNLVLYIQSKQQTCGILHFPHRYEQENRLAFRKVIIRTTEIKKLKQLIIWSNSGLPLWMLDNSGIDDNSEVH